MFFFYFTRITYENYLKVQPWGFCARAFSYSFLFKSVYVKKSHYNQKFKFHVYLSVILYSDLPKVRKWLVKLSLHMTNTYNIQDCIPCTICFTIVTIWLLVIYSEFVIALAMAIVWVVDDDWIHTLPFIPTVHSKGKYFPRDFKRTNSLLRSLEKKKERDHFKARISIS